MSLSDFSLENKVALITGGTSGLGKMMALALAKAGAFVWIASSRDNADETIHEIKQQGYGACFIQADVTSSYALKEAVSKILNQSNRIDILVNAAGINLRTSAEELTLNEWQKTIDINLTAPFYLSQLVADTMKKNNWGRIINISSVEGRQANKENVSHYITFKHAMNGFTKAVAFENGAKGITCNAISPGAVETDLMMEQGPAAAESMGISYEEFKQNYAQESSIKRLNTTDEVSGLAVFLCSELGSGITGAILPVDGGTSL